MSCFFNFSFEFTSNQLPQTCCCSSNKFTVKKFVDDLFFRLELESTIWLLKEIFKCIKSKAFSIINTYKKDHGWNLLKQGPTGIRTNAVTI